MSSLSPSHPRYSRAGPHPGKLRHQRGSPRSFLRGCAGDLLQLWGLSPCIPQRCLLWEGMCWDSSARALSLHLPPNSLVLHQWLMSRQLSGVTRDSKSHPWPLGSRIPQWEPARIHFLSVSALPGGAGVDVRGVVTPGTAGGAEPSWLEQQIQQDGWAWHGEGAGQGPSSPAPGTLPSCPRDPPLLPQCPHSPIPTQLWHNSL